jgi:23S rRNA (guanosine2251-2'-O)-methyltransferase
MFIGGKNVVKEVLNNNQKILKVYIWDKFDDKNIINELTKRDINIKFVSKFELDKIDNMNHQGIILDVPDFQYSSLKELLSNNNPFLVMLDHIEDPHNFGAIIRTCEAAGVDGIIIPKDRSVSVNSTVMKTSSGALNNMKICMVTNLNSAIAELKDKGLWIVGTDIDGKQEYNEINYDFPVCLIIGSEGFGMSRIIKESCDYIVKIPMKGKVNSLNASVAAGILIYKIFEKRN